MPLDPNLFRPAAIGSDMTNFNAELAAAITAEPDITTLSPDDVRRRQREGTPQNPAPEKLAIAREITCAGPAGPVPLRIFVPERCDGVYLHIHGGGWVLGSYDRQDGELWAIAQAANVAVISVEYRLAPEHPYPAGPDDCEAAAEWLVANCKSEFGSDRLLVGGDSAGAHLSATTILRMRDRHGYRGWRGADLVYGAYDFTNACPSRTQIGTDSLVINATNMKWFENHFVGAPGIDKADPDISPLRASLHDLPPALFSCGTLDPLLDDTLFMHARWIGGGNAAEIAIYPGGTHAFDSMGSPLADACFQRRCEFIRLCLRA